MQSVIDVMAEMINDIENSVIHSMQENDHIATGKTIGAFQTIVTETHAQLITPLSIDTLEYGRGPTRPGVAAGDPTVFEAIQEWCAARGIEEGAAYAITKKIHEEGTKIFREGGNTGVLSVPLSEDNLSIIIKPGLTKIADLFGHQVANMFDVLEEV